GPEAHGFPGVDLGFAALHAFREGRADQVDRQVAIAHGTFREGDAQWRRFHPVAPQAPAEADDGFPGLALARRLLVQIAERNGAVVEGMAAEVQQRLALEDTGNRMVRAAVL